MKFYKLINRYLDAPTYYQKVFPKETKVSLLEMAKKVFQKTLCKEEQISNWEKRALSQG
jgi:ribonuclease D